MNIYKWFLDNSKVCRWFVYDVCGVRVPQTLAVVVYFGAKVKLAGKTIFRVLSSEGITTETVFKSIGPCFKSIGFCLLIGIGALAWMILEFLDWIYGCVPNPDEIHGYCSYLHSQGIGYTGKR